MGYIEEVSKQLFSYNPPLTRRDDFDEFWEETLKQARIIPLNPEMEEYDYPSDYVKVYKISYNGFDSTRIYGWYILPLFTDKKKLPCLIHYHGGGGNKGKPADYMHWITMGIAVIAVDCREQSGDTGNSASYSSGSTQNVNAKGLLDKYEYYTRALYMDNMKAIDFSCTRPELNSSKIIIEGGSQGGGIGMAVCALDDRPWLALMDVPSNTNIEKRVEMANGKYSSVTDYLKIYPDRIDRVFETLSYFDTMNMADRIRCKVFASVGLKDNTAPALYYFATYNRIKSEKEIRIYPFNGHEGGGKIQEELKLRFLRAQLK